MLQDYTSQAERSYFKPNAECSKAYDAAEQVLFLAKKAKEELAWSVTWTRTSQHIMERWAGINAWCNAMNKAAEKFDCSILDGISKELECALSDLDDSNVNYSPDDGTQDRAFEYEIDEYAGVLIKALKREMCSEEANLFDDNH